jgi:uncharacterized protein with FMN-binding domain
MPEMHQAQTHHKLAAALAAVFVIAGLVLLADHWQTKSTAADTSSLVASATTTPAPEVPSTSNTPQVAAFADGSYSASESYFVPPGEESIKVSLTLSGGIVTDVQIANSESDPTSAVFQEDFAASYKSQVVGKAISGLNVHTIAGASDTAQAFNDALSQIRSEAQA